MNSTVPDICFEAAVAHYQATGKSILLDVACRFADLIDSIFGPGKQDGLPGHEGIELALVKLAGVTGEKTLLGTRGILRHPTWTLPLGL